MFLRLLVQSPVSMLVPARPEQACFRCWEHSVAARIDPQVVPKVFGAVQVVLPVMTMTPPPAALLWACCYKSETRLQVASLQGRTDYLQRPVDAALLFWPHLTALPLAVTVARLFGSLRCRDAQR